MPNPQCPAPAAMPNPPFLMFKDELFELLAGLQSAPSHLGRGLACLAAGAGFRGGEGC